MKEFPGTLLDYIWGALAALGAISFCIFLGLYCGGFFHSLAKHMPQYPVLQLLFGGAP